MTAGRNEAGDIAQDGGVDRRTMLKAAAAAGVAGATWTAPRIETLGFAPAGAATPCTILSPESEDKNSNQGQNIYCSPVGTFPCCSESFGNQGNQPDRFVFTNPFEGCASVVVRMIPLDCELPPPNSDLDPSIARFALVIESQSAGCNCVVQEGVLLESSMRFERKQMNNGPSPCLQGGVDSSIACDDPIYTDVGSDARLAVRIACITGPVGCVSS